MIYLLSFAFGTLFGAGIFYLATLTRPRASPPTAIPTAAESDNKTADIMRQWNNLLNYDGRAPKGVDENEN